MRTYRRVSCTDCGRWDFCTVSAGPFELLCDECVEDRRAWDEARP